MPNRQLTPSEIEELFTPLLSHLRERLQQLSGADPELLWALRRKLAKELSYDERGKPMHRKLLKARKRGEQQGKCARCSAELPEKNTVLDRIEAMKGYTRENTRLLCPSCDVAIQEERGYS
jgi:ribosomal protein L44E